MSNATSEPLNDNNIVERLKASQRLTIEHARPVFEEYLDTISDEFADFARQAKSNQEQDEYFRLSRAVKEKTPELSRFFLGYLGEGFIKFKKRKLNTTTGEERFQGDMLSLVDNEDLEEIIAISSIARRAENFFAETLWALNQRFAVLNHGHKVTDQGNPISPIQYCESLRRALVLMEFDTKAKLIAYKAFDREFVAQLGDLLSEINEYLIGAGILPNLRYTVTNDGILPVPQVDELPRQQHQDAALRNPAAVHLPTAGSGPVSHAGMASAGYASTAHTGAAYAGAAPGTIGAPDPNLPSAQYQERLVDAIKTLQSHITYYGNGNMAADGSAVGANSFGAGSVASGSAAAGTMPLGSATGAATANETTPNTATANTANTANTTTANTTAGGRQALVYTSQQLVGALQGLQSQALIMNDVPSDILAPANIAATTVSIARELRNSDDGEARAVDPVDMHTIDLVGMLFEYMLSDDNLPDSVKALLSYLHTPFLKIAFIDKSFFEQTEHPARLLLNHLAEAGVKWVGNDGSNQYEIHNKIKHIVSRVLEEFKNDVRLFAELLLDFSGYTKKISRRQELVERRAMEKVQGEEKLREVKMQVNQAVRARTDGRELPSAVLLLLLQPWSDYLAFILLRYGEDSDSWQRSIAVIDQILWSIEPKDKSADKTRQMEAHDQLLDAIEVGFETIGYDSGKGKKLLEALFSLQRMALQSKQVEPAPEPMRNKLESMAAEKAGQAPADSELPSAEEARLVESLKMIEFGTWFEFSGGKRLKVAWYNSKTLHYMLVDQMGKKVAMSSGLQLAKAMLAGEAKVIAGSAKPFFERALENIFQSLNNKAEAMTPGSSVNKEKRP